MRYAYREGFTGPEQAAEAEVPAWSIDIRRPAGSEQIGFLITTESLDITETWDPPPGGPAEAGTVFKRTIVQRAPQVSGMALAPAPTDAPDGIRVYGGNAETRDQLDRGDFIGERSETITYLLEQPGTRVLPALSYVWWNPATETLQSKELPAVSFEVTPSAEAGVLDTGSSVGQAWTWALAAALLGLVAWRRRPLTEWAKRFWRRLHPPDRVAARRLLRACRHDNPAEAESAWAAWRSTQGSDFLPGSELQGAVLELMRVRYGPVPEPRWSGTVLAETFKRGHPAGTSAGTPASLPVLPMLNSSNDR